MSLFLIPRPLEYEYLSQIFFQRIHPQKILFYDFPFTLCIWLPIDFSIDSDRSFKIQSENWLVRFLIFFKVNNVNIVFT